MIGRREFITLLGGGAVAWPLAARGQQRGLPVIGLLSSRSAAIDTQLIAVFRQALNVGGFVEGQAAGSCDLSRASASGRHCCHRRRGAGTRGQGGNRNDSYRI